MFEHTLRSQKLRIKQLIKRTKSDNIGPIVVLSDLIQNLKYDAEQCCDTDITHAIFQ